MSYRIGIGYDTHQLVSDRKLILGGVTIPFPKGLLGHSDADVLLHAITDAILGACGKPDIGNLFPDNDSAYKDIDSRILLSDVLSLIKKEKYQLVNIDSVILCQAPKLMPYIGEMKKKITELTGCEDVNVKATTTEKMNAEGEGKCISAQAVCLVEKK